MFLTVAAQTKNSGRSKMEGEELRARGGDTCLRESLCGLSVCLLSLPVYGRGHVPAVFGLWDCG